MPYFSQYVVEQLPKVISDPDALQHLRIQTTIDPDLQKLAVERQYEFILDKSEGITVIFADPKLDKSDDVLRNMGVK